MSRAERYRVAAAWLTVLATVSSLAAAPVDTAPEAAASTAEVRFPVTFERVWYRTEKQRGVLGSKLSGDLTISGDSLQIVGAKRDIVIPTASIGIISLGTMRGDVDTEWAVLSVDSSAATRFVGLRDGRKMGYGQHTKRIYDTLIEAARRHGFAQYNVPAGFVPYTELDFQFAMAVPQGWFSYHDAVESVDGQALWGRTIFTPDAAIDPAGKSPEQRESARREAAAGIRRGAVVAWIIDRREAEAGMSCSGFSERGVARLLKRVAEDPFLGTGVDLPSASAARPLAIDRCQGVAIGARASSSLLELRAVSDDRTVFVFALRGVATDAESDRARLDRGVASVKFSVAR